MTRITVTLKKVWYAQLLIIEYVMCNSFDTGNSNGCRRMDVQSNEHKKFHCNVFHAHMHSILLNFPFSNEIYPLQPAI